MSMKKILSIMMCAFLLTGCFGSKEPVVEEKPKEESVSFVAVGDNLMYEKLLQEAKTEEGYDFTPFYNNIKSSIQSADVAFVNQETILGGDHLKAKGYPNFNTPEIMAKNLQDVGFDVVNGATNHSLDQGGKALKNSIEVFKHYPDLTYLGLYESKEDRDTIRVMEKNGIKIAWLSYNQMNNGHKMPNSYCLNLFDEDVIKKDVQKAKEISDCVIVSCHWGNEYETTANSFQKKYAKLFADLGVDVVLGTHSHTLQPVEWVEGKDGHRTLVAYSLGNFVSGMMEEETQLEGMLSFDVKKKDGQCVVENVLLTPMVNHYEISNLKDAYGTRHGFTVYKLDEYSEGLASQHGLNGYQGISIDVNRMQNKVKDRIDSQFLKASE